MTPAKARPIGSRDNNFTLLRFVAAGLVIVSHGIELPTAVRTRDWLFDLTGFPMSWYAVGAFFAISGFLIQDSWDRRPSLSTFVRSRVLRIWPGLLVMLLVTVPVLGLFFSTLPPQRFFSNPQTATYFLGSLSIVRVQYLLPGVFESNPLPAVNGSLWTLRYELLCYLVVGLLGAVGLVRGARRSAVFGGLLIAAAAGAMILSKGQLFELCRLGICFLLGAMLHEARGRLPLHGAGVLGLTVCAALAVRTPLFVPLSCLALSYAVFWFAFVPDTAFLRATRRWPDYSYGLYIYAFPIQQALIALGLQDARPAVLIALSFLATLPFAALSWHLVEKPALRLKRPFVPHTIPMETKHGL